MKLLLDTHVAIWAAIAPKRLPVRISALIGDPGTSNFVSTASIWEIAIKFGLRQKEGMPFSGTHAIRVFQTTGFTMLDVRPQHVAAVDELAHLHADPFDRLILAQALTEPMQLVTHDHTLKAYSDTIISW